MPTIRTVTSNDEILGTTTVAYSLQPGELESLYSIIDLAGFRPTVQVVFLHHNIIVPNRHSETALRLVGAFRAGKDYALQLHSQGWSLEPATERVIDVQP